MHIPGFDKPSGETLENIKRLGVNTDGLEASLRCDLKASGKFGDVWLFADENTVYSYDDGGAFIRLSYSDFEDIAAESYVSSGSIVAYRKNGETVLSSFSLGCARKAEAFIAAVRKLKGGAQLIDADFSVNDTEAAGYKNNGRKKLFFRLLSYMPRYKNELAAMIALVIAATLLNMLPPYISGKLLYDQVLAPGGKYFGMILPLTLTLIAISALTVGVNILHGRIGADMSGKIIYDIKTEVFEAMQRLGMSFFSSKRTGNLMNRVNGDALDIQYFLNDGLPQFCINILTVSSVGLVLFIKNPLLSAAVLVPVPLIALIIKKSARKTKKLKWFSWRSSSALNSLINDSLMGIRVIKAFGKEKTETERFSGVSERLSANRIREGYFSAAVFPVLNLIMLLGGLSVWGAGGAQVLSGRLTFGELMTFTGYLTILYAPVNSLVRTFDWWTNCMNSAQRIFEVTDSECDVPEPKNPVSLGGIKGRVEMKNVTFSYLPNRDVLKNVSFCVQPGEMIGLVGHSGAGKSTITNLITRLYDVKDGAVKIDGVNVKDISSDELHSHIGMVLQETFLFDGTVMENIAYGNPKATEEEIIAAAKSANAHDFISHLPDGYQTVIGSHGVSLSGGEKQRISIARAVLTNPSILILDEATSSLDTETEEQIREAIDKLVQSRTTIAIAHRLSTLKNASRLVVVEQGRIVESGTHEELMKIENGIYRKMAQAQIDALRVRNGGGE